MVFINAERVSIDEVISVLTPAPEVSLDQAIADAELAGFRVVEKDYKKNEAKIIWFKKENLMTEEEIRELEAIPDINLKEVSYKIPSLIQTLRTTQLQVNQISSAFKDLKLAALRQIENLEKELLDLRTPQVQENND